MRYQTFITSSADGGTWDGIFRKREVSEYSTIISCSEERDKNQASNELDSGPPKLKLREPPQDDWSRAAAAAAAISAQEPLPHTLWSWGARLRAAARVPIAATTASSCKTPPRSSQSPSRHALSSVESGSPIQVGLG
ncbi:hypothetical protein C8R47DRAFT_1083559 [Mycena vitilis]|nr:hypothetical protein C8R47DRAFT_1083559 [Mycena vitilis]